MGVSDIRALLELRGMDLRQEDIDELAALLTQVDPDEYDEVAGWVWEAVALIVEHPEYTGDAKMPEAVG